MMLRRFFLLLLLTGLVTSSALAQRDLKEIPTPDPELERKTFVVADGFEVSLFAADPMIGKPIQMNFDPQGRLWIASSEVYPHIEPGQKADDKIIVLEDKDGDGASDQSHVFARGLLIPTGVVPGDGGAYVANSTELVFFADADGDLKSDSPGGRTVLSGFGTEDTHHILHTLRWGHDGCMYFNQSIYIHSHIETPYGVKRLGGGGIWRFRPETMELDIFTRGLINPWGHQIDSFGQSFATDGAGGEGINYMIPGAAYRTAVGVPRVLNGLNPGSPKHCGLEIVSGATLPEDWQNNLITCDFRGHRVCRFVLSENGSGYSSQQQTELLRSDHVAFRPIDVAMGPDGAIYIADWYNPIIQHGEVDFRDHRRDHTHGRIWRVARKNSPKPQRPNLLDAEPQQLLEFLKSKNHSIRDQARRVVKDRQAVALRNGEYAEFNAEWEGHIQQWLQGLPSPDNKEGDVAGDQIRLEALWTFQALRVSNVKLLNQLLLSKDGRVRAAALRVATDWQNKLPNALQTFASFTNDEHPRVRLEAVRALSSVGSPQAVEAATRILEFPLDRFLEYGLWLTVWEQRSTWLPAFRAGEITFQSDPAALLFVAKAVNSKEMIASLIQALQSSIAQVPEGLRDDILQFTAQTGSPAELRLVFDVASEKETEPSTAARYFQILADAGRRRRVKPSGDLSGVETAISGTSTVVTTAALECAGVWRLASVEPVIAQLAGKEPETTSGHSIQKAAIGALADLSTNSSKATLDSLTKASASNETRLLAVAAQSRINPKVAAKNARVLLTDWPGRNASSIEPMFRAFLSVKNGTLPLSKELDGAHIDSDVAKTGLRVIATSGRDFPQLSNSLTKAGRITSGPKQISPEEMKRLVGLVSSEGDPGAGELVYRRAELQCMKCHAVGGAGGKVGPDFTSLGGSAQVDYLIQSMYDPNAKVKENYHSVVIATADGKVFSGIKIRTTDKEQMLRTAEGKEISIPLTDIEDEAPGISLMPPGLTDKLTTQEFVDLVCFLSALGREPEFSVTPTRTVRKWDVMNATKDAAFRLRRTSHTQATSDDPAFAWKPAFSKVAGDLPLADLPQVGIRRRSEKGTYGFSFARFSIEVTQPGEVGFVVNDTSGLEMWVGPTPVKPDGVTMVKLSKGQHRVTISVDRSIRKKNLKVSLTDLPESAARAQLVQE